MVHHTNSRASRTLTRAVTVGAVATAVLLASAAHAGGTPEQACQKGRYDAAAKYASCHQKALAKLFGGAPFDDKFQAALSKCRVKYTDTWAKLQAKASGSGATCDNDRYDTDVAGTVIDRLTGLQWEQKTDDAGIHDKDTPYNWGSGGSANGSAFTTFLPGLNSGGCFAGQCDWRLPTIAELQTILLEPYPCTTSPCINQTVFGLTAASFYWSATTHADFSGTAWGVIFNDGGVSYYDKLNNYGAVRAVRAGL